MKQSILFLITILISIKTVSAQVPFEISAPFTQVVLRGAIQAEFIPADRTYAVVTVNGTDSKKVEWSVKNGKLSMTLRVGVLEREQNVSADVKVYYRDLNYIGVEGASLTSSEPISVENLKVETLGGINRFSLEVSTQNFEIVASGDCKIAFGGVTKNLDVKTFLGAYVDCGACLADNASATARQRSEIVVKTSGFLNANATSASNIFYIGTPTLSASAKTGGGVLSVPSSNKLIE